MSSKILVVFPARLGDCVIATAGLRALIAAHPNAEITIACAPHLMPLFAATPQAVRLIKFAKRKRKAHWLDLWLKTFGRKWHLVADFRGGFATRLIPAKKRMTGGRKRMGESRRMSLLNHAGLDTAALPRVDVPPLARDRARRRMKEGRWVGVCPTAGWEPKCWPGGHFAELAQAFRARGHEIAVFYAPGEEHKAQIRALLRPEPGVHDLGGLALDEAAACLERCALFLGGDSGLSHLAAALNVPTLALFGPTSPAEYAPSGAKVATLQAYKPGEGGSMADLGVRQVLLKADEMLAD